MLKKASPENLYKHVEFLTSIKPFRNYLHPESLEKAAEYIKNQFSIYTSHITEQKFCVEYNEYKNIIASINTDKEERIIIGAHYDVAGDTPGADDNASGIAGLIELLRLLHQEELPYRIDFAAYSLEEPPFFATEYMGSYIHAHSLHKENAKIKVMICLEMIGYFSDQKGSQQFPLPFFKLLYPDTGNFIGVVGKIGQKKITVKIRELMKKGGNIPVYSINAPSIIPGVDLSDHRNFWQFGYQAVMITDTAFYRNPNYHRRTDTVNTLDYKRMAEVINGLYYAIKNI